MGMDMTWNDLLKLGPTRIAALLGCPVTTAHTWIRRRGGPPEWQREKFLAAAKAVMEREQDKMTEV